MTKRCSIFALRGVNKVPMTKLKVNPPKKQKLGYVSNVQ